MNNIYGIGIAESCENTTIHTNSEYLVASLGIKDLSIIHTDKVTLVYPNHKSKEIKELVLRNIVDTLSRSEILTIIEEIEQKPIIDIGTKNYD